MWQEIAQEIERIKRRLLRLESLETAVPIFGGIHVHDASAAQSIATGTTYTKLTCYTDNNAAQNVTPDAANDKITLTIAGYYQVSGSFNFADGTNNVVWRIAPFLNGTEQDHI